jgi:hypothetical protein
MWNLMKRQDDCSRFREFLEDSATAHPGARTVEELTVGMPAAIAAHFSACPDCAETARELLTARKFLTGIAPASEEARPWFTSRVMAAIAVREKELQEAARTWLAVPRFASRVVFASAALLLIASTWLYERPAAQSPSQPAAVASPEYIFEAPTPPASQDDVLVSMAERKP